MRPSAGLPPLAAVLVLVATPPAASQAGDEPLAVVERLFAAMRSRDTAAMRATFDSSARLVTTATRSGQPVMRSVPIERWLAGVAAATVSLDERIWDAEVRVDDNLATVWVKYEFVAGGEFSHCGVDAFQLFKGTDGWKIFHIADTQRRENCWRAP